MLREFTCCTANPSADYIILKKAVHDALMPEYFPQDAPVQDFGSKGASQKRPTLLETRGHSVIVPWAKSSNSELSGYMDYANNQWSMPEVVRPPTVPPSDVQLGLKRNPGHNWNSKLFGIKGRYDWTGFYCMEYVGQQKPPPVPEYWSWSQLTLSTEGSPFEFRAAIFDKVLEKDMTISMKSNWLYIFETVSPHYLETECQFFRRGRRIFVDINQLSGDRFQWSAIASHIRGEVHCGRPGGKRQEAIIEPWMNEELFDLIGPDMNPAKLLSLLKDASPNIRRCALRALYHCDTPFDVSRVEPYCRGATTFLENRIQHWANKIVRKGKNVAHL